jgi:hypothetical protein
VSLLSQAADERAVVCVIDVQWLDQPSVLALAFLVRRLLA